MAYEFAASMVRRNHQVTLVHGPIPSSIKSITPEMEALGVETVLFPGLALPWPWRSKELAEVIRRREARGVVAFNQLDRAIALRAAARVGVPGFISAQNMHRFRGPWPWNVIKESYYGRTLRQCARLIMCVSPVVQQEVLERFQVSRDRTVVLLNGIDVSRHKRIDPTQRVE
jgi:hypothetical protein